MKPRLSIIVPVHNLEKYLNHCIDSILNQTFTDFELILINDGSIDASASICEAYAQKDSRVRVIHQNYQGVSGARNAGVRAVRGEYVGFIDGDDYVKENMLEVLYGLAVRTKSDISICKLGREIEGKVINEDNDAIYSKEMDNLTAMRELFKGELYRFSLCNKLFKKSCFTGIRFPEGRIHEDLSTTYRLFARSEKAVFTNYTGYIYVKRQNSILTSRYSEKRLDALTGWKEILIFMKNQYPLLYKETVAGFGYWSVDNLYYVLNQVGNQTEKKKYLSSIQSGVRHYYRDLLQNRLLSVKYKSILSLLNYNPGVLLTVNNIKNRSQRKQVTEV